MQSPKQNKTHNVSCLVIRNSTTLHIDNKNTQKSTNLHHKKSAKNLYKKYFYDTKIINKMLQLKTSIKPLKSAPITYTVSL